MTIDLSPTQLFRLINAMSEYSIKDQADNELLQLLCNAVPKVEAPIKPENP
jgi:hypothetical protein